MTVLPMPRLMGRGSGCLDVKWLINIFLSLGTSQSAFQYKIVSSFYISFICFRLEDENNHVRQLLRRKAWCRVVVYHINWAEETTILCFHLSKRKTKQRALNLFWNLFLMLRYKKFSSIHGVLTRWRRWEMTGSWIA